MFTATILLCLHTATAAAPTCVLVTDQRGPHARQEACRARTAEMKRQLDAMLRLKGFVGTARFRAACERARGEKRS